MTLYQCVAASCLFLLLTLVILVALDIRAVRRMDDNYRRSACRLPHVGEVTRNHVRPLTSKPYDWSKDGA